MDKKIIKILLISGCLLLILLLLLLLYNQQNRFEPPQKNINNIQDNSNNFDFNYGIDIKDQKTKINWEYKWSTPPYGSKSSEQVGVLQIVNGGNQPMWINYAGSIITDNSSLKWETFITTSSELNNNTKHLWYKRGEGVYTFKLNPNEYQIVPFTGSAAWISGSLGCCEDGSNCIINTLARGGGSGKDDQGSTLFEWTVPGVWDASAVDGFNLPLKIEIDGCENSKDCNNSDSIIKLKFTKQQCINQIIDDKTGTYLGCKSMCGCQTSKGKSCPDYNSSIGTNSTKGYCGCDIDGCSKLLRNIFNNDAAGMNYCNSITEMAPDKRGIYCQAYDDNFGTKNYGNGIIKITMFNIDFDIPDRTNCNSPPTPTPTPTPTPPPNTNCCLPNTNCTTWCCDTQSIQNGKCPSTDAADECSRTGSVYNTITSGDGNPSCGSRYVYSAQNNLGGPNYWNNVVNNSPNSTGNNAASKLCAPCAKNPPPPPPSCCLTGNQCTPPSNCCNGEPIISGKCQDHPDPSNIPICSDSVDNIEKCNNNSKYIWVDPNYPNIPSKWGCSPTDNGKTNPWNTASCINKKFKNY